MQPLRSSHVFTIQLVGLLPLSFGAEGFSGSGEHNNTSDESFNIWPGILGVTAASFIIVLAVTVLVCTTMFLVHCCNEAPNKARSYTLREAAPKRVDSSNPLALMESNTCDQLEHGSNSPDGGDVSTDAPPEGGDVSTSVPKETTV